MSVVPAKSGLSADRPFAGLRPYRFEDQDFFFGRDDQVFSLYRLFDHSRFIAVVGSSGSGKSSLVRAGLLPLLDKESREPTGRTWKMIQMHPGDAPIDNLAAAMAGQLFPNDEPNISAARRERLRFALRRSSFGMADALQEQEARDNTSTILVVDQFEELFRYTARRQGNEEVEETQRQEEATQFVQVLLAASRDRALNVYVLITMRSDFIGDCANFRGLPETVSASQFLVPALTRDQREEVVRRPIEKARATIEPALVERLLNDSGDDIDQLPVLQHCLSRLWEEAAPPQDMAAVNRTGALGADPGRAAPCLTLQHYLEIGGISRALSKHADTIFEELSRHELAVEQCFRSLAEIDSEGRIVRRARLFSELLAETGVPAPELRAVVDRFRNDDCSFLTPSRTEVPELADDARIDVCHEALLRRWDRVSGDPRTGSPYTGWIRLEVADGRLYRGLLAMAESKAGRIAPDNVEARCSWWKERPRTAEWAKRYGGNIEEVERLFKDSLAALEAEIARKEAERAAEQRRNELEAQAARAREETEKARLELAAQSAHVRELAALRYARLARLTVFAVSVLLFLAAGLGWMFYQQRQAALHQTITTERSLRVAINSTTALLNEVLHLINTGGISLSAVKSLLDTAEKTLAQLADFSQTPAIQAGRALALLAFADTYSALQDSTNALALSQQARDIAAQLGASDPGNMDYQKLLYSALFRIGDAETELSDIDASLGAYNAALAIARRMASNDPANYTWMQNVAFVTVKIGDIYKVKNQTDQALKEYQIALAINQKLAQENPDIDGFQRDLATSLTRIGDVERDAGNLIDALASYQSALKIRKALADKTADDASLQSNLSAAYNRVAYVLVHQERFDDAAALYNLALAIRKALANGDPTNVTWQSDLAFEYVYIGDMLMAKPDFANAAAAYSQSAEIRNSLATRDANNFTWLRNLADSHTKLADALAGQSKWLEALDEHRFALPLRLKLGTQFPDSSARQRELANEHFAIGMILQQQNDSAGAIAEYQAALAVIDDFVAKYSSGRLLDQLRQQITQKLQQLQSNPP